MTDAHTHTHTPTDRVNEKVRRTTEDRDKWRVRNLDGSAVDLRVVRDSEGCTVSSIKGLQVSAAAHTLCCIATMGLDDLPT